MIKKTRKFNLSKIEENYFKNVFIKKYIHIGPNIKSNNFKNFLVAPTPFGK